MLCFEFNFEHMFEYSFGDVFGRNSIYFQVLKLRLRVQKKIVFLPPGGGVGQFENKRSRENILQLCGMCAVCFIVLLKAFVSCQALAQGLQENSTLTNLDLRGNNIGDEGAKAWCGEDGAMSGEAQ